MLHAMIMAGGGGTRFWPRSRQVRPKQFLTFSGDRTLLQGTVDRIEAQVPPERTWVITGEPAPRRGRRAAPRSWPPEPRRRRAERAATPPRASASGRRSSPERSRRDASSSCRPTTSSSRCRSSAAPSTPPSSSPTTSPTRCSPSASGRRTRRPATATSTAARHVGKRQGDRRSRRCWSSRRSRTPDDGRAVRRLRRVLLEQRHLRLEGGRRSSSELADTQAGPARRRERIADAWGTPRGQDVFRAEYAKAEKISIDFAVMEDAAKAGKVLVMQAPVPAGTTSAAGWRSSGATRRTRTATPSRRSTRAWTRRTA